MIEFLLEVVLELAGELLFNVLIEGASRGVAAALSNRVTRIAFGAVLSAAAGFGGGLWWGRRLSDVRETPPKLLYVAGGLAVVFAVAAVIRARSDPAAEGRSVSKPERRPWVDAYWSASRLATFAIVNIAVAAGVAAGFDPYVPS